MSTKIRSAMRPKRESLIYRFMRAVEAQFGLARLEDVGDAAEKIQDACDGIEHCNVRLEEKLRHGT
jgi:hypothetical protein